MYHRHYSKHHVLKKLEQSIGSMNNVLNNAQQVISNTRRSLTDLIIPSAEISETLSIPRKTNVRRENDYVKIRPKIEKLRFSTPTYPAAGVMRETPL